MTGLVVRRFASLLVLLIGLSVFAFVLGQIAPGDTARSLLQLSGSEHPGAAEVTAFRHELGLDDPAIVQYRRWAGDAVRGDLGTSFRTGQSVAATLRQALPVTVELASLAFLVAVAVGVPVGVFAALAPGRAADHAARVLSVVSGSMPSFWLGYLLILLFSVHLHLLPSGGVLSPRSYVLPAVTLSLHSMATFVRLTRASMLEVLGQDFIQGAMARGVPRSRIVVRHALRVAMNPILTQGGVVLGGLLAGAVIVETVFGMPGIGKLAVDAIIDRDFPMVQGFVLLAGTLTLTVNLAVDLLYGLLDPRARLVGDGVSAL